MNKAFDISNCSKLYTQLTQQVGFGRCVDVNGEVTLNEKHIRRPIGSRVLFCALSRMATA